MTESPKPPPRPLPRPAEAKEGPPPLPLRGPPAKPVGGTGTAPLPGVVIPPSSPTATASATSLTREPARDTLAPSSFGVIGGSKPHAAPAPAPMRTARAPMPTLGDLEGATATATLRPPGAVPPPPRALPMPTPQLDAESLGSNSALETPLPGRESPFTPLAGGFTAPRSPRPAPAALLAQARALSDAAPAPAPVDTSLDATLDMASTVSKKATQAALVEQTRSAPTADGRTSSVPAPGLFIADEPLEPRPKLASMVTVQRQVLTRMRVGVLLLGGLFLMVLGALVALIFRRTEASGSVKLAAPSASSVKVVPGCRLAQPPSRISAIERGVPIATLALSDGNVALGIADTKTSAAGWIYDPIAGETKRKLEATAGSGDVTHVTPSDPLLVDHGSSDFAFAQTLAPGLALGVGPSGILRRGEDGATGVVWPLTTGVRVTPPRVASTGGAHFVAFRQGGAEGQLMTGWLHPDGSAFGEVSALGGAPKTLGTPSVATSEKQAFLLFAARQEKSEPYRVLAARAWLGKPAAAPEPLELPAEGGGAIAPSLAPLGNDRFLVQWTDGNVGQYQVHVRLLNAALQPLSEALLVSAKGANAGQGTLAVVRGAAVSFFIQTTAGHDELWGATLSCQ